MKFVYDDGGRKEEGYKGHAGDCVCRAIAIVGGIPYGLVYAELAHGTANERKTKHSKNSGSRTARNGIFTSRKWFKDYMRRLGFRWVPTMQVGSGCKVHLTDGELPNGRLVVAVSKHYTAVIDGVIHDTYDPQREAHCGVPDHGQALRSGETRQNGWINSIQRRCVYGYWIWTGMVQSVDL